MDLLLTSVLEQLAATALPPLRLEEIDGWVARYTPGLATRRANSVWPREHGSGAGIAHKLEAVERFYAACAGCEARPRAERAMVGHVAGVRERLPVLVSHARDRPRRVVGGIGNCLGLGTWTR